MSMTRWRYLRLRRVAVAGATLCVLGGGVWALDRSGEGGLGVASAQDRDRSSFSERARPRLPESEGERWSRGFAGVRVFTKPSRDAVMGFSRTTSVLEVLVSGGQLVERGDLLVRGDDREDEALLRQQRVRAETSLPIERERKIEALAKVEYERMREVHQQDGAAQLEVDRARLNWETSVLDARMAVWQQEQEAMQVERAEARVEALRLRAPFDGVVESVKVDEGDTIRESEKVVRVVRINPLWMDVHAPVEETLLLGLEPGDPAWVLVDYPGEPRLLEGRVVEVSPVADFSIRKRRVRVEADNPEGWPPGLGAWVRFQEPSDEWRTAFHAVFSADGAVASKPSGEGLDRELDRGDSGVAGGGR